MTAEQLRNSILQEAISGRLVPQDPNDEPASVLLQHIREEKARLVKEGKLKKKDLVETPIAEDEIPFEIPSSWVWVRLNSICDKIVDGDHNPPQGLSEQTEYVMISSRNINNNQLVNLDCVRYLSKEVFDIENLRTTLTEGDILFTSVGSLGRSCVYSGGLNLCFQRSVSIIHTLIYNYWLKYYFDSSYYQNFVIDKSTGTAQVGFYLNQLSKSLIAVPPLAEQKRIVAKLEELLPIVEQYGKAQTELDQLNAALPARLCQSILQEAISGKLVPQDKKESADGLKEQLLQSVNNSPLKKRWSSEPIEEDELPFDIPENWQWIRLGDIVYTQTGLSYSKGDLEKKVPNPIRVLRGGNIQNGAWCTKDDDVMIAPEFVKKDIFLKKNSFITPAVTSLEHLGKTALIREDHNDIVAGGFVLYLLPYDDKNDALMEYLAYFFQSAFYNSFCKTITNKSGQAFWNISREKLLRLTIPLPPLAEQQRIVAKIEELFEQIDKISK